MKIREHFGDLLGVLATLLYMYIVIEVMFPIVNAAPVDYANRYENTPNDSQDPADDRMVKPPRFPYDGPYGYYSSGLLCVFDGVPYLGGWFGRSCAGPMAPFMQPTPPSTIATTPTPATTSTSTTPEPPTSPTTQAVNPYYTPEQLQWWQSMMQYGGYGYGHPAGYNTGYAAQQPGPYDDYPEPEGSPWVPDDDDVFIETYGRSASKPGFKLGDPNQH